MSRPLVSAGGGKDGDKESSSAAVMDGGDGISTSWSSSRRRTGGACIPCTRHYSCPAQRRWMKPRWVQFEMECVPSPDNAQVVQRLRTPVSTALPIYPPQSIHAIHVHFRHHPHHLVPLPPLLLLFARLLPPISRSSSLFLAYYISMGAYCALGHIPYSRLQLQPDLPELPGVERCIAGAFFPLLAALVGSVLAGVDDGDPATRIVSSS
ncbi:hypothetical protein B0H11DRAFT_2386553 [Mycena galericulata]|nr:hypothetical protein B0H11DRAFT_2386553 [Mycena galericulata]